jgi:hypothetical protein
MDWLYRLQRLCAYLFLVAVGTLAAALALVWISGRLGAAPPAPGEGDPLETVVVALVIAMTSFGFGFLALHWIGGLARVVRPAASWLVRVAAPRAGKAKDPRRAALWGAAALAVAGLLAGLW